MANILVLLLMVCMLSSLPGHSQQGLYAEVDKYAIGVGRADSLSLQDLSQLLTGRWSAPEDKVRAIYTWIAHNIAYDCPAYHNPGKRKDKPEEVMQARKAVCGGYANLFCEMCSHSGIQCLTIDGYALNGGDEPGLALPETNHSWNTVRIGQQWQVVDVTWGSGFTDSKVKVFTPQFSETYFFTDPYKFLLNHFPYTDKWKPAKASLSKSDFFDNAIVMSGYIEHSFKKYTPAKGIIKSKVNTPITITLTHDGSADIESVSVVLGEEKKQQVLTKEFTNSGSALIVTFQYKDPGSFPVKIYINNRAALKYMLELK